MDEKEKLRKGEKVARNATMVTALLAVMKFAAGMATGSIVLVADAFHSTVDILTIAASWAGLKIAQRKPTQEFPYGFYKAENLATLLVSSVVIYLAFGLFKEGFEKLFATSAMTMGWVAVLAALISSVVSFIISKYEIKVGKEINSDSLLVNGKESRIDTVTSFIVFLSIILAMMKIPVVEGTMTIIISLLVLKIGVISLKDSVLALMDVSPSKKVEEKVKRVLKSFPIKSFEKLKLRKSGPFVFGEVTVSVEKYLDVNRANMITETIEEKVRKKIPEINHVTVRIKPCKKMKRILVPVKNKKGIDSEVMQHFGRSNYYAFIELDEHGNVSKIEFKENLYKGKKVRAGLAVVKHVISQDIDALVTKSIGEISFHALRDNFVDLYKTQGKTIKQVIEQLKKGKLKAITRPMKEKE